MKKFLSLLGDIIIGVIIVCITVFLCIEFLKFSLIIILGSIFLGGLLTLMKE